MVELLALVVCILKSHRILHGDALHLRSHFLQTLKSTKQAPILFGVGLFQRQEANRVINIDCFQFNGVGVEAGAVEYLVI